MILNRIQPFINPLLRNNQNGFRPGRSTTTHIHALRRVIIGIKSHNMKAIITFVDFRKAFVSINISRMFKILSACCIPRVILDMIPVLHVHKLLPMMAKPKSFKYQRSITGRHISICIIQHSA